MTIADEQGRAMDRGGAEAIRKMEQQENDQLAERLGKQMKELFAGLTLKQEEDNRRLKEENQAIRRQMVEMEKARWEQDNRMERLMEALLLQLGGQALQAAPGSSEVTPVRGSRPEVVMPEMPSTQQKQARSGVLAPQGAVDNVTASAASPGSLGAQGTAELVRRSQMLEEALRSVQASGDVSRFLQSKGHHEVAGMITSGGVLPSGAQ